MSEIVVNGVRLYDEVHGQGEALALVHGSWGNASNWALVVPGLAKSFRVLTYDRRGHTRRERTNGPGSVDEDADDLAALLEALDLAPAHVVASSSGGNIALRLAASRPELFRSVSCHEPPLVTVLEDDAAGVALLEGDAPALESVVRRIEEGDHEGAAQQFVDELAFGPGTWENRLPPQVRQSFVHNAPTFLDEYRDPTHGSVDHEGLASLELPIRLTDGSEGPPTERAVIDRLVQLIPRTRRETMQGVGHVPQMTAPEQFVESTTRGIHALT